MLPTLRSLHSHPLTPTHTPLRIATPNVPQEIRDEVLKMRGLKSDGRKHEWDAVGSKHDAGDRELVENGAWTEVGKFTRPHTVHARTQSMNPAQCTRASSCNGVADWAAPHPD